VAGNHKPSFKGVDEAIRRRVLLVPFLQVIPEEKRDEHLPEKLKAEWPAILRWAIDGCLAWQREGLAPPESARAATKDYLDAEDLLGQWLEESCVVSPKVGPHSRASTTTTAPGLSLEDCTPAHHKRSASASTSEVLHGTGRTKGRASTASNCGPWVTEVTIVTIPPL
jgi:hypothetical protein